jgi:hypothetical protein
VKGAVLQQRVAGAWTKVAGPVLKAKVKLVEPASFRIAAGKLAGSVLKVPVAPAVTLRPVGVLSVSGTVRPLYHFDVELQREDGGTWTSEAFTATDVRGAFTATVSKPGVYRARVATNPGSLAFAFAEGLSGQIELR